MLKKTLSVFLSMLFVMLCFFSVPAFAAEPEFDIRNYTIEDLEDMTTAERKDLLANFIDTYNPYGIKELMAQAETESGTESLEPGVAPQWKSDSDLLEEGQQIATHQLITLEALAVFIRDFGFYDIDGTTALYVALTLAAASALPDFDETDSKSFKGHFYDPDSGQNYLLQTSPTAKTRVGEHYANATSRLRTNVNMNVNGQDFAYVLEELGRALHYMQDVCEPHHASNQIGGLTSHAEFENYVDDNIDTFLSEVPTISFSFYSQANNTTTQNLTHTAAVIGKLYSKNVGRLQFGNWAEVGKACLTNSVYHSARLIYKLFADNGAPFI